MNNITVLTKKPWGSELLWADKKDYAAKLITINPKQRLSKQYHAFKEETIYVLKGTLILEHEQKVLTLNPGQSYHIKPGEVHRFCAPDDDWVELMEVSTTQLEDVVRLEDDYDRKTVTMEKKDNG